MKTTIVLGPPGTGKTTKLLSILDEVLARGIAPQEVGFVSFTKKAANEARDRAAKQFNFSPEQMPWFRTLHSLAFNRLGYSTKQTMQRSDYRRICDDLRLPFAGGRVLDDQTVWGQEKGDRMLFMENLARLRCTPLKAVWEETPNEDINWDELDRMRRYLLEYKQNHLLLDFTDMLSEFVERKSSPFLRVLFVDEAQDLAALQWRMVNVLKASEETFIAGDDDQAIYRWAGADVEHFIGMPGEQFVLGQSYRVPSSVAAIATGIIAPVQNRRQKLWKPRQEAGEVCFYGQPGEVDMSKGSWLLLARNGYLLRLLDDECLKQGYSFESVNGAPVRPAALLAIRLWERLRKGERISSGQALAVYDFLSAKKGFAYGNKAKIERMDPTASVSMEELRCGYGLIVGEIWHESLDRISVEEREYVLAALRRGEKLGDTPRIKISTIHGAKGGEAENVLLITDMAYRTWKESKENPDDESRVWYVAVTRAKERLHLINPATNNYYEF